MADNPFFQTFKHSFSLADIDPDIDLINYLSGLYQNDQDSSSAAALNFHNSVNTIMQPQNLENLHGRLFVNAENAALSPTQPIISSSKERKRRANDIDSTTSANTSSHSSPQVSDHSGNRKTNRGKRARKGDEKEDEKPREVIHVRAKRGQATDSHSLAERVRRGKINERLRCLQDIVPGCYKTMGMAVMLDEIINYVQSLQNQVDFLSMKLTAASSFYDFNTDTDSMVAMQQRGNSFEANPSAQFSQLGQNLGYSQQQPHTR